MGLPAALQKSERAEQVRTQLADQQMAAIEHVIWPAIWEAVLGDFATRYNETWLVARHGYRTPAQVRADQSRLDPNSTANLKLAA